MYTLIEEEVKVIQCVSCVKKYPPCALVSVKFNEMLCFSFSRKLEERTGKGHIVLRLHKKCKKLEVRHSVARLAGMDRQDYLPSSCEST